jgi:hypothetical protein
MKQIQKLDQDRLSEAQRIIDYVRENHFHPANDTRHPRHQDALTALFALEKKVFNLIFQGNNHLSKSSD